MRTFPKLLAASALIAQAVLGSAGAAAAAPGPASGHHGPSSGSADQAGHRLVTEILGTDLTSYVTGDGRQGTAA
ncbi:hypothetical protein G3I19_12485 [Streptomyces sp. SID10853]|uniref:hypothetical protein n=1 Tax=Streptomyces sp. SID10853 TaxID=2706028 RepID=UPI0013BF77FB|nr:hypothetical protein [Streptomyces sp. SID10853]NDZ79318.1 hypothetical protein [Streptomyces sp. SID10853]